MPRLPGIKGFNYRKIALSNICKKSGITEEAQSIVEKFHSARSKFQELKDQGSLSGVDGEAYFQLQLMEEFYSQLVDLLEGDSLSADQLLGL